MEKDYNLSLYDIKSLKKLFKNNSVVAYGNGSFFNKIKEHLKLFNLEFVDILYTQNDKVVSTSGKSYEDIAKNSAILICSSFSSEILKTIKNQKNQPKNIKIATFLVISDEELNSYKQELAKAMQKRHEIFVQNLKSKEKIRVVFLVLLDSVWKVDTVFKKMLDDPYFEPVILVIPYTSYGEERMWEEMTKTYEHFKQKDYPTISSYNKKEDRWITLDELNTDIVFFTAPHNLTKKEYYEDAYLNYLSCYAGYGVNVAALRNLLQFNQTFHNTQWINFANSKFTFKCYKKYSSNKGKNAMLVGDMICETLLSKNKNKNKNVWKNNDGRIRIIYAPHHSIEIDKNHGYGLSTFLEFAYIIQDIAIRYKNKVVWAFKPHPILKSKLYRHSNWGKEKTDDYYNFWENQEFTQLEETEYIDLFKQSDAMIHDSASFLYEYLTLKKPVVYLTHPLTKHSLNKQGKEALNSCRYSNSPKYINKFILKILKKEVFIKKEHKAFFKNNFNNLYKEKPSEKIYNIIKNNLLGNYR